ncbi:MAG: hydroxymethylbilane synthase [Leptospiraceae bacterium]|nr:hydroxymethylbilane synthase [Leptospiraceae bacterium]MDW7976232.1 hydroxymethylbilane synthase [Leptospiraceae bacterium]
MRILRIATRGSHLAVAQAEYVQERLKELGVSSELVIIKTTGDLNYASFTELAKRGDETKGLFTKEIEEALLKNTADIAVHSLKDLPTKSHKGLIVAALPQRLDYRDYLIFRKDKKSQDQLPFIKNDGVVGTSSFRRKSMLRFFFPSLKTKDIRGNVPTRIKKLFFDDIDAILLSGAGLERLSQKSDWIDEKYLSEIEIVPLDAEVFPPSPGQGTIAVQCRESDKEIIELLKQIHDPQIENIIHIERGLLAKLEGGCHLPLGIHSKYSQEHSLYQANLFLGKEYPYSKKKKDFYLKRYHKDRALLVEFLHEEITEDLPIVLFGKEEKLNEISKKFLTQSILYFPIMEVKHYKEIQKHVLISSPIEKESIHRIYAIFSVEGIKSLEHHNFEDSPLIFVNGKKSKETLLNLFPELKENEVFISHDGTAFGIAEMIMASYKNQPKIIYAITAKESRNEFFDFLMNHNDNNTHLEQWITYEIQSRTLTKEELDSIPEKAYLIFGSPSLFDAFYSSLKNHNYFIEEKTKKWRLICLGKTTFQHILRKGFSVYAMSSEPSYEKIIKEFL